MPHRCQSIDIPRAASDCVSNKCLSHQPSKGQSQSQQRVSKQLFHFQMMTSVNTVDSLCPYHVQFPSCSSPGGSSSYINDYTNSDALVNNRSRLPERPLVHSFATLFSSTPRMNHVSSVEVKTAAQCKWSGPGLSQEYEVVRLSWRA